MCDPLLSCPGPWSARSALLLLVLAATACGTDPTVPEDDTEFVGIFAEDEVTMSASAQLLLNGDMEPDRDPWWNGSQSPSDFFFTWANGVASSGSRSLAIQDAAGATGSFSFWAQDLDVVNPFGMTFQLSVSIKLEDVQGEGVSIAIRGDNTSLGNGVAEAFSTTQSREVINGTRDWATYTVELSHLPASVDQITVYFVYLGNNTGTAYFDDATLSVSETIPTVALQNTDMEQGGTRPDAWWFGGDGLGNYGFVWSDTQASSGQRSLSIVRGAPHPEEFGFWAQTIDAASFAGGSATLSVKIQAEHLVGVGASIVIRADVTPQPQGTGEAFVTTEGSQSIVGTPGWESYQVTLQGIPSNVQSVTVYLVYLPGTSGVVYFDEVSLVPG